MSLRRTFIFSAFTGISLLAFGCGNEKAEITGEQASSDLRANLENSSKAAGEVAKEKKTR
ncbi:hypothetical protein Sinac_0768 [Singulisphaera acidiphila DSM 18658]|uniref:Uncharacterized protein n=1 Tax=Singulisphaera acidiphila (strain ATCC BAA-1392 / DSM 18658 / VKM B-2454 / MOB10) TaxID=886293 RepID=L0D7F6_SINAD|nr:hypothetical protein Sinac_0768 [Singulisphaera acidiphila DSM 18658]